MVPESVLSPLLCRHVGSSSEDDKGRWEDVGRSSEDDEGRNTLRSMLRRVVMGGKIHFALSSFDHNEVLQGSSVPDLDTSDAPTMFHDKEKAFLFRYAGWLAARANEKYKGMGVRFSAEKDYPLWNSGNSAQCR